MEKIVLSCLRAIIEIEERLWQMAARLRANTPLRAHEYAKPVLGLIFLKLAYETFKKADQEIKKIFIPSERGPEPDMYRARNAIFLPEKARYPWLLKLTKAQDIAGALKEAMEFIEEWKQEGLGGVLPKNSYVRLGKDALLDLLRGFDTIELTLENEEDTFHPYLELRGIAR